MSCARATAGRCLPDATSPGALETPPDLTASHVLLFLLPLRFSPVAINFFLPVQEHRMQTVPSAQLVLDSRLSYLLLDFSSLAKAAQLDQFFHVFWSTVLLPLSSWL